MGIISTDLKPYYSEDRTDRIRTIGGPPVLRFNIQGRVGQAHKVNFQHYKLLSDLADSYSFGK